MGGGTTRVGDPSGKDASRQLLPLETIAANKEGIKRVFAKFLNFGEEKHDAIMPDNAEWLATLNYIDFLRDVGRHFSVNRMLAMDLVKLRLERDQELSFLEFNYMCLQAYDFVELFKRHGCVLQMGGSDQWGNIVTGIDLGRRMGTRQLYGLTSPLLTSASGAKMGKTAQGAVWLEESMLPVFDYWQYWRNCEDRDTGRFLKLFTELPLDEIARLEALGGTEINEAKKILATEATAMVHGREAALRAAGAARQTFEEGALAASLPSVEIPAAEIAAGLGVLTAFVRSGLVASTGEARRQIIGGGLRINDETVTDERATIGLGDVTEGVVQIVAGEKAAYFIEGHLTGDWQMPNGAENLVLEHLRHIRGSVDRIEQRLDDLTTRVGHLVTNLAHVQVQLAEHSVRFDRLEARIARIEKRLELGDAPV